jgi:glutathione S-transferase
MSVNLSMSVPILYSFRRCPYAMRARMALAVSKVEYEIREIELKSKPVAMLQASPKGTVPVLVLPSGRVIDESLDIMHWALGQNDPEYWLPQGEVTTKATNELITTNDGSFKFHLDRMKYANRYDGVEPTEHRSEAVKLLVPLEARLSAQAYLFGNMPTLGDIAIFPFVRQFAHADAVAFAALPYPALQGWLTKWEGSALFNTIMAKYPQWKPDEPARA